MVPFTRISIVEDTDSIREILKSRINETDDLFCITDYQNAEDAILDIPEAKPDIVIMDIGLPGMSGIECMMKIKKECPDIAFLMFTVFDNDQNVFDALKAGANGYIMKDEKPSGVILAIREYLNGGGPMSAEIAKKVMESFHRFGPKNAHIEKLTSHQLYILKQISDGLLNKEIAANLNITEGSIKVQINRIYKKLQVNNRIEAINKYLGQNRI